MSYFVILNAKILVKEDLDKDLMRIYTLELESLESTKPLAQAPNGDLADHLSKSKQKSDTSLTPLENVSAIIPQTTQEIPNATKANKAQNDISKIDTTNLTAEQKQILQVFKGEIPSTTIQGKDLNDLYTLESGSRQQGGKKNTY